jgi:putative heme-binding domain-containing protein
VSGDALWDLETRRTAGGERGQFLSSRPGGERATGRLSSEPFVLPRRLSFEICGHRGHPDEPARDGNRVELRLADGRVVRVAWPPRNDRAQRISWDLDAFAGRTGSLELVDELSADAFAWLAVARIEPAVVGLPELGPRTRIERQQAAVGLVESFGLEQHLPELREILLDDRCAPQIARATAQTLARFHQQPIVEALAVCLSQPDVQSELRGEIRRTAAAGSKPAEDLLRRAVQQIPYRVQQQLAAALTQNKQGAAELLQLVELGIASAHLLQQPALRAQLLASDVPEVQTRVQTILDRLPARRVELDAALAARRTGFQSQPHDASRGLLAFQKHCAACHRVGDSGAIIGPQLDGIGNRGLERLLEDLLDPNRNLDAAFHTSTLALTDGRVMTGLFRRQEGDDLIFAATDGKEFRLPAGHIEQQQTVATSLMPDNFATQLPEAELYDLLDYLLTLRQK